jgi:hypothetical protein
MRMTQIFGARRAAPGGHHRPAGHVVCVRHGDRTVLLDHRRNQYYGLDEVGTRVWSLLAEGVHPSVIVQSLAEEFDAPRTRIESDTAALLAELAGLGLVSRS